MFNIYLLRHGHINCKKNIYYGITDYDLSNTGVDQINNAIIKLNNEKIDSIITSPLKRTIKTAQLVADKRKLKYSIDNNLTEKSFGIFENLTFKEIEDKYPIEYMRWMKDWYNYEMPEGESAKSLHSRCIEVKNRLLYEKKNILVVSHLGCIRYLISELLSLKEESMWRFSIGNGKIAKIIVTDEGYTYLEV